MGLFKKKKTESLPAIVEDVNQAELVENTNADMIVSRIENTALAAESIVDRTVGLADKIVDVYQRSKEIDLQVQVLQAAKEVELAIIANQYELCREVILGTFGQRQQGLAAHYKVLDKALQNNDRDMIVSALKGISSIVVTNPLEDFTKFVEAWNDKSKPLELDF